MNSNINNISILLFLGAAQGFILAFILFSKRRGNIYANRILSTIIFLFSLNIALHTLVHTGVLADLHYHAEIVQIFFLIISPAIYFYVHILTDKKGRLTIKDSRHMYPFFAGLIMVTPLYTSIVDSHIKTFLVTGISVLVIIQAIIYISGSLIILKKHSRNIQNSYASIERINLNWLRILIMGYIVFWLGALLLEGLRNEYISWNYAWLVVSFFIYMIGYKGLLQPEIFSGHITTKRLVNQKYKKSTLTVEMADTHFKSLKQAMSGDKLFMDNDITLPKLAKRLSISTHHLSQIINEKFHQNFFDFINKYRVEEAKLMLNDPAKFLFNISTIGYDVGFNSISAFNSAFKKHTGMTPLQFRKSTQ